LPFWLQSPQPELQLMLQTPLAHEALPLMVLHVLPQLPQFRMSRLVLVSQLLVGFLSQSA
jgi:hypothetical protein